MVSKDPKIQEPEALSPRAPTNAEEVPVHGAPPTIAVPFQPELAPTTIAPQSRDDPERAVLDGRTESDDRVLLLFLGVLFPEGKDVTDCARFETFGSHKLDDFVERNDLVGVEVEELPLELTDLINGHRELLLGDVAVLPVVAAARDALGVREVSRDGEEAQIMIRLQKLQKHETGTKCRAARPDPFLHLGRSEFREILEDSRVKFSDLGHGVFLLSRTFTRCSSIARYWLYHSIKFS